MKWKVDLILSSVMLVLLSNQRLYDQVLEEGKNYDHYLFIHSCKPDKDIKTTPARWDLFPVIEVQNPDIDNKTIEESEIITGLHSYPENTGLSAGYLPDMPLVEIPAVKPVPDMPLMVCISGDGGWKEFIDELSRDFAKKGIPVAGIDALKYFWDYVAPEKAASDIAEVIETYYEKWNKSRVIILGYSFGANVIPFIINRLPEKIRSSVALVVMLSPDEHADFEFHFSDWLDKSATDALPVLPEIEKMKQVKSLLIVGEKEDDSIIDKIQPGTLKIVKVPGGHYYNRDFIYLVTLVTETL